MKTFKFLENNITEPINPQAQMNLFDTMRRLTRAIDEQRRRMNGLANYIIVNSEAENLLRNNGFFENNTEDERL